MTNRNCGSCRHFLKIDGASTGHCTNPLVVSHQGGLVMYREAEIGCRRGWKQDLWEPRITADDQSADSAAAPAVEVDLGRAAAWANSAPREPEKAPDLLADTQGLNDEDLFDPRKTRDIREAIRRAREAKKREVHSASRREAQDRPILSSEQRSGEDTVLDVRPAPLERRHEPIVPPVSADEIRKRVDEMRHQRRLHEPPPNINFRDDDERYTRVPDLTEPESPVAEPPVVSRFAGAGVRADEPSLADDSDIYEPYEPPADDYEDGTADDVDWALTDDERSAPVQEPEFDELAARGAAEPAEGWPEQAPWAQDEPAFEEWIEQRPKRRSWLGSLLHRHHEQAPAEPADPLLAWEPDEGAGESDELEPWNQPREAVAAEGGAPTASPAERVGEPMLPPLPYDTDDDELGEDYLLTEGRYGEPDEEDQATARLPRVCATCRYFRPDGTCGNSFAFTFRRRVNEDYLSCASSIGSWWLPSDRYWESVVDFAHHGQPTPLLDRFELNPEEQEPDDEILTP